MQVQKAPDIQERITDIVLTLNNGYLNENRIICMRSYKSTANAYARIWNFPKIWQEALDVGTYYIIEVLHEHFDKLSDEKKDEVLIHELLHIPKTFSGALLDHGHPTAPVNDKRTKQLLREYKRKKEEMEKGPRW
jgi:predicted metallopeptidase